VTSILKVLAKIYIKPFYAENASFFLVVIGVGGGFMSGVEHKALAEFFISSPSSVLIPVFIWALYAIKVANFNAGSTQRKENEFIFNHSLYPTTTQFRNLIFVLFNQLAPAILYGLFLSLTAIKNGAMIQLIIIIVGLILILVATSLFLKYKLTNPNAEKKVRFVDRILNRAVIRPYPLFIIEWLARKKTFLLISTMSFCSVLLFGVLMLYTTDVYDIRLLQMVLVIVASGNVQLIQEIHYFETFHFSIINQQPLSFIRRACYLLPVFLFISFPPLALLVRYFPDNLNWLLIIQCVAFLIGYPFFLHGALYRKQQTPDEIMRVAFVFTLILFVLSLFSVPLWAITIVTMSAGLLIWNRNFYTFERTSEMEGSKKS
jgi:hypothetical protein